MKEQHEFGHLEVIILGEYCRSRVSQLLSSEFFANSRVLTDRPELIFDPQGHPFRSIHLPEVSERWRIAQKAAFGIQGERAAAFGNVISHYGFSRLVTLKEFRLTRR